MPTLVLRKNFSPAAGTSARSASRNSLTGRDRSFEGILVFSGIGLALMMFAIVF